MKPQLAVSFPDKYNRHQFGGDCQVMMAEGGERSDENVVDIVGADCVNMYLCIQEIVGRTNMHP